MPYCADCAKYWTPSAMGKDGSCPNCHRVLENPARQGRPASYTADNLDLKKLAAGESDEDPRAPWHFKVLVVALIVYLGWRVVDLFV